MQTNKRHSVREDVGLWVVVSDDYQDTITAGTTAVIDGAWIQEEFLEEDPLRTHASLWRLYQPDTGLTAYVPAGSQAELPDVRPR